MSKRNKVLFHGVNSHEQWHSINGVFGTTEWQKRDYYSVHSHQIDNKYYSTVIEIWVTNDRFSPSSLSDITPESVDGFVMVFDPSDGASWKSVCSWEEFLSTYQPSVALCLAITAPSSEHLDWCIDHQVELVELNPEKVEEGEKYGFARVLESLHNHMWEHSVPKSRTAASENVATQSIFEGLEIVGDTGAATVGGNAETVTPEISHHIPNGLLENLAAPQETFDLESAINGLKLVREKATTLPDKERRAVAAKIALTFASILSGEDHESSED